MKWIQLWPIASLIFAACAVAEPSRQIALTFDDVPRSDGAYFSGAERATELINALDRADVRGAMFFVTTRNLEARGAEGADRLRRYTEAGHILGNHSHAHLSLSRTPVDEYLADIDRSMEVLSAYPGTAPLFRYPFLHEGNTIEKRDAVREGLARRKLKSAYVTVDTYDWYLAALAKEARNEGHEPDVDTLSKAYVDYLLDDVEFYDRMAREALGRSPKHVLLLHENDLAALFIGDLVDALRANGWELITAADAFEDPIALRLPATLFLGQGRVAAIAHESGRPANELRHETEDEDFLRASFVKLGLLPEVR